MRIEPLSLAGLLALAVLVGCSSSTPEQPAVGTEASADVNMGEHEDGSDEDVAVTLAKLPEGDREAAIAQKDCPVSEHPLGSMGVPVKVAVEGRDVFICCEGCRDILEKEPAKFLAKLDKK